MSNTNIHYRNLFAFSLLLMTLILGGCSSSLPDYANSTPNFDMQRFFNGKLHAYGMVQDRSGKVIRRFKVDLVGSWQDNKGRLEEDFYYADGETQRRVWLLTKQADGSYNGTANDVIGTASGRNEGFAFNWRYVLAIAVQGKTWHVELDDWLYQLDNTRLINRTQMTKWGFNVGEITLVIEKTNNDSDELN